MGVPDNGPVIAGVTWWLCFFCGAFLALRIYAKLSRHQGLWWDDYILIFSWTMLFVESILTQVGVVKGFGKRTVDIPVENLSIIALGTSVAASISCFASTGSKISFGVTLLRLTFGPWRWFVWFSVITLFVVMIPSALFTWIQCTPREKAWNFMVEGSCWDPAISTNYGIFNAAWCAVIDFALALLPWKLLWRLRMETREKVGVGIAMSMGLLSGVCAIVKGVYIVQLRQQDFYYNGIDVTIWTAVETATAIIAASIPVLRVFFKEAVSSHNYNAGSKDVALSRLNNKSIKSGNGTEPDPTSRNKSGAWVSLGPREDTASDKSILGDSGGVLGASDHSGILQTNTVIVDDDGKPDARSEREERGLVFEEGPKRKGGG